MRNVITILFILLCGVWAYAQEPVSIGAKHKLYSEILHEDREYWVHLPEEYAENEDKKYPVLYLLDGDRNFTSLVAIEQGRRRNPFIIVGVLNTDRGRDMTPSHSLEKKKGYHPNSGGAEKFHEFLTKELRKCVHEKYRTNGNNTLLGHSFGGLFTMFTFLNHNNSFDTYLALDPSFWWDNEYLLQEYNTHWDILESKGKTLYMAKSGSGNNKGDDKLKDSLTIFHEELEKRAKGLELKYKFEIFENETHGSMVLPASINAIKFMWVK